MDLKISSAIRALMICKKKMKNEDLLEHDDMKVILQISAIKVAPGAIKQTVKLPLVAPFRDSAEVCLFVKDLKRGIRVDHEKSHRHWREFIEDRGVTRVTEVVPLRQVKAEYSMYEAKRKLCDAYDVFLTDVKIARLLPSLLGKHFVAKKKQPIAVNMEASDLVKEIDNALNATYLHIYNNGDSSAVQVGRCGQSEADLRRNVSAVVDLLKTKFPGGLQNIRSLNLKLGKSPSIPIYVSDVLASEVPVPPPRYQPGSRRSDVTGELSTLPADSDVTVTRHGDVIVTQKRPLSDDEELSDEEDQQQRRNAKRGKKFAKKSGRPPAEAEAKTGVKNEEGAATGDDKDGEVEEDVVEGKEKREAEDSSDEEDRALEAQERRFLDNLASQKSAATEESPAVAKAAASVEKRKKKTKKGGTSPAKEEKDKENVKISKKGVKRDIEANVGKTGKKVKNAVSQEPASVKVLKKKKGLKPSEKVSSSPKKDYSKKTAKQVTKVKKVK